MTFTDIDVHGYATIKAVSAIFMAVCGTVAYAGNFSWTMEKVSIAINRKNVDVITTYAATAVLAPGSRITNIYASRSYNGDARVETRLCWNDMSHCVLMGGSSLNIKQFNGFEADKPVYLVHTAVGDKDGPLPSPVFVKGSVIVWYAS
ncbi:hypothetical protein EKL30_01255 [Candidimonas sp. SYP-B2681]|uniref:hypothetical protein n=1 Tax=Candidimonas sp. SYP-B2681 TaxID=2497686 RepID=UPI000FC1FE71|nr:hypothetical protein [Candidimonas sp. SYP-B2681]RTZ47653.1 hypothetical protein EKL30_01255 [Candidimonas sp. SYP-B2681]